VDLDTRTFYAASDPARKLGIGSSAAICTAVCGALAQLSGRTVDFQTALSAHRLLQQAQGSGIDVAASFSGGVIRFEAGTPTSARWPNDLHYQFVWTGVSAKTTSHLATFAQWRGTADTGPLDTLVARCHTLFESCDLENLARYVGALKNLDKAATLGIYTEPHLVLDKLAIERQLVYKPCGAGGGDIGIAFGEDPRDLDAFAETAARLAFHPLSLEIAAYGLKPTR
jgi:phosphomevalonate kinase